MYVASVKSPGRVIVLGGIRIEVLAGAVKKGIIKENKMWAPQFF